MVEKADIKRQETKEVIERETLLLEGLSTSLALNLSPYTWNTLDSGFDLSSKFWLLNPSRTAKGVISSLLGS